GSSGRVAPWGGGLPARARAWADARGRARRGPGRAAATTQRGRRAASAGNERSWSGASASAGSSRKTFVERKPCSTVDETSLRQQARRRPRAQLADQRLHPGSECGIELDRLAILPEGGGGASAALVVPAELEGEIGGALGQVPRGLVIGPFRVAGPAGRPRGL